MKRSADKMLITDPEKAFDGAEKFVGDFPFSFFYGRKKIRGFGALEKKGFETVKEKREGLETKIFRFALPDGIEVRLKLGLWRKYGVSEWTVFIENGTGRPSEIISELKTSLNFEGELPRVEGIMGDHDNFYRPYSHDLTQKPLSFYNDSGRPTHVTFPYFDLKYAGRGAMLAIGWAGSWKADFHFDGKKTLYEAVTPADMRTRLKPGESLRSALHLLFPYPDRKGNLSSDLWRRWFIECNMPRANAKGEALKPFSTAFLAYDTPRKNTDGSLAEAFDSWKPSMDKMIAEGLKADFRWFDAGWYCAPDGRSTDGSCYENDWFATIGTWELDKKKWPGDTFRRSTDYARENGMKTLVWFEPERVTDPESLEKNYGYKKEWAIYPKNPSNPAKPRISNNIGDPECFEWTLGRITKMLRENRVEMYREDNNIDSGPLWRQLDGDEGEDRRGITEMKLICAHYRLWDEIIKCTESYGGCSFVDSCASGGGRNDLESLRRGIPLLRSDYDRTSTGMRLSMTASFNRWIPFCGACTREQTGQIDMQGKTDRYIWRASYLPVLNTSFQYLNDPTLNFAMLREGMEEWKSLRDYYLGDLYVHTPWRPEKDVSGFAAFSYVIEDGKKAAILAFRQEKCSEKTLGLELSYLKKTKTYVFTDADTKKSVTQKGSAKLRLDFETKRSSKLIFVEEK
ncbi:MAG: alpha-galactosidase [Clostridia bacterium]|nr:alpha-galactosidase [Clostridia bacterium]